MHERRSTISTAERRRQQARVRSNRRYRRKVAGQRVVSFLVDVEAAQRMLDETAWREATLADGLAVLVGDMLTPWK